MAWQTGTLTHQYRKEAAAALRAHGNRVAIKDEQVAAHRAKPKKKPLQLEYRYRHYDGTWSPWRKFGSYACERDRQNAMAAVSRPGKFMPAEYRIPQVA